MEYEAKETLLNAISDGRSSAASTNYIVISMDLTHDGMNLEMLMQGGEHVMEYGIIEGSREALDRLYRDDPRSLNRPIIVRRRILLKASVLLMTLGMLVGSMLAKMWWMM